MTPRDFRRIEQAVGEGPGLPREREKDDAARGLARLDAGDLRADGLLEHDLHGDSNLALWFALR